MFRQQQCHLRQVCHIIATKFSGNSSQTFSPHGGQKSCRISLYLFWFPLCLVYRTKSASVISSLSSSPAVPGRLLLNFYCRIHLKCPKGLHADANNWPMKSASAALDRFFFIWSAMFSSFVTKQSPSFEMVSYQWIWRIICRHLLTKVYMLVMLFEVAMVVLQKAIHAQ